MFLIEAIKAGNQEKIKETLAKAININVRDQENLTALMHACQRRDITIISLLLQHDNLNLDLDDLTINNELALMMAAPIDGDWDEADKDATAIVKAFLALPDEKLQANHKTINYALNYCAWLGDEEGVQRCLELGADPNNTYLKTASLSFAVASHHENIVDILLSQASIDVNQVDYRGDPPLVSAICCQQYNIAAKLIADERCNLTLRSFLFGTPLMAAIFFNQQELAKKIISEWHRCDLDKEIPTFLLTIQKGREWEWLFYHFLTAGIDANADCKETYEWLSKRPKWMLQEADAVLAPLGESYSFPIMGDKSFILDRPIWVALHCDNRNAIKWLLGLGANLDIPSEFLIKIDPKYSELLLRDEQKHFIANIDKKAGFYVWMDYMWEAVLELGSYTSAAVHALIHETNVDRFKAIIQLIEDKRGEDSLRRFAEILHYAYHEKWKNEIDMWQKHAKILLVDRGIQTLYGKDYPETLYLNLSNVVRDRLISMIQKKVKDYCVDHAPEPAFFSEDELSSSSSDDEMAYEEISKTGDIAVTEFSQSFELLVKQDNITLIGTASIPPTEAGCKPIASSIKFSNMNKLIDELTVDHPLFSELYNLLGLTSIARRPRDATKVLAAIKGILSHEHRNMPWSYLQPSSYYFYRLCRNEQKLGKLLSLCEGYVQQQEQTEFITPFRHQYSNQQSGGDELIQCKNLMPS